MADTVRRGCQIVWAALTLRIVMLRLPKVFGHLPFLAVLTFAATALLSRRLVTAIARSGHL
ncbi:MAG TPA: hypothetical protein VFT63_00770 [bacterium]|nr:hypothetical protein [bacterium]